MLGMPATTAYDLNFRVLGIPVRVHPLFWLVAVLLGRSEDIRLVVIWVACVFASILAHELGHGLMARDFRCAPSIVLYGMGGLCYSEAERQKPWQRVAVLLSGPGAGFVLLGFVLLAGWAFFGITLEDDWLLIGNFLGLRRGGFLSPALEKLPDHARIAYLFLIEINLLWGILNLFPIWPLDGGQISGVILSMVNRRKGMGRAHVISLLAAGLLAMWMIQKRDLFMGIFFAYFAFINYQVLQSMHQSARYGASDSDADWWKR